MNISIKLGTLPLHSYAFNKKTQKQQISCLIMYGSVTT